jgi:hypothetical protein
MIMKCIQRITSFDIRKHDSVTKISLRGELSARERTITIYITTVIEEIIV